VFALGGNYYECGDAMMKYSTIAYLADSPVLEKLAAGLLGLYTLVLAILLSRFVPSPRLEVMMGEEEKLRRVGLYEPLLLDDEDTEAAGGSAAVQSSGAAAEGLEEGKNRKGDEAAIELSGKEEEKPRLDEDVDEEKEDRCASHPLRLSSSSSSSSSELRKSFISAQRAQHYRRRPQTLKLPPRPLAPRCTSSPGRLSSDSLAECRWRCTS
jgi:hypothetical protein